jgi:NAD(P)-dependent dehydrogenase (short-subunit alcohol dehydrogenase family)
LASTKTPKLFSLAEQGVIVTGGARGLGLCIATSLLEASASYVYCVDILGEPAEDEWAVAERTAKEHGGKIAYHKLDITDEKAVQTVFAKIYDSCPFHCMTDAVLRNFRHYSGSCARDDQEEDSWQHCDDSVHVGHNCQQGYVLRELPKCRY